MSQYSSDKLFSFPLLPESWHLRVLWVGIGCGRGTSRQLIERAILQVFQENQLAESAIAGIATIDTKSYEVGLVELCHQHNLPLKTFPSHILNQVPVPNPSKVVALEVGTFSVAEAAALCAAANFTPLEGLKVRLLVAKQIFRLEGQPGAVTVAVAQAEKEFT